MKIALVAQHSTPVPAAARTAAAGDDARLVEMSRSLAGEGHQVTVYARRTGRQLPERADLAPGVSVEYVGPADPGGDDSRLVAQVGAFSAPLHDRWAKDRPDVVHAMRWTSGLAALAAARDLQVPVVQSFDQLGVTERRHGLIPAAAGTERIRLEPAIGRTVDAVVASSCDEETDLTRLGIPRSHIRVVPTGIDTSEFTPDGPARDRNERRRLVTVADLAAESESLAILLQAMAKIPGAELVIAGGPAREDLRGDLTYRRLAKLSDALDLQGRVFFAGQVARAGLPPLLRSADLMVNVNQHEATAITSIQAMACGTPVVATANGAHLDAVVDGTTGILVQPLRPALLAQKIRALLAHPMLLEAFSVAAVDRARSRYSWDRIAHETLAVYDTALAA
ncbi:MAG TPA: glycosyltransferase [Streptosporangiaceae bacterium]|nr:glycosyltransferase [Streptosporangiaceae bacterium]